MSTETTNTARIHRHGDRVALYCRQPEETHRATVYLSKTLAANLALELGRYARDCEAHSFTSSTLGTSEVDGLAPPSGENPVTVAEGLLENVINGNRGDVRAALLMMSPGMAAAVSGYMVDQAGDERGSVLRLLEALTY